MATLVGFNSLPQRSTQRPMYKSKSKGLIAIADMHNQHLFNAYRKQILLAFSEELSRATTLDEILDFSYSLETISNHQVMSDLYDELIRRNL